MPCNVGYKSYAVIKIPESMSQAFKTKTEAPKIDAELLAKLGSEDSGFLEWANGLDARPLLKEAIKRALVNTDAKGVEFSINSECMLEAKGSYLNDREKRNLSKIVSCVSERWRFEILGIVTQLLGYTFTVRQDGDGFILEAEEEGKSHPCGYIKVSKKGGNSTLVFEHFKSRKELQVETAKLLILAHKLGVKIVLGNSNISEGDPFPSEHQHTHGHSHGYHHNRNREG